MLFPIVAVLFLHFANARVTFPYAEVLQAPDILATGKAGFQCKNGCKAYVDVKNTFLKITQNGNIITDFNAIVAGSPFAPTGVVLPAADNYMIENRGEANPKFVFYVIDTKAPNYGALVFVPQDTVGVLINNKDRLATILSSFEAVEYYSFNGDFPDGYPRLYATGYDSVGYDDCHPVYQARSQYNAEMTWPKIATAVITVDFGFVGAHNVSVNQVKIADPVKGAGESTVYTSPGFVGCKFNAGQNYYSALTQVQERFTLAADRLDIDAAYDSIGGQEGVQFNVNNHKTLFVGSDTYHEHYDKDTYDVLVSWVRGTPQSSFAIQLDFGSANDPPISTTTKTGRALSIFPAIFFVLAAILRA